MEIGIIGLGRMGANICRRLLDRGHRVMAYDQRTEEVQTLAAQGAVAASSLTDLASRIAEPRAVWVMVTAGEPTEETIAGLASILSPDDIVLDGGNSYYKDSQRRAQSLSERGVHFLDVGTSGGIWGLQEGYCLMVGGEREVFERLEPVFQSLAPGADRGYAYVGPTGAGHFVKMVHNGIEYGLMQAYAEGFELMEGKRDFELDLAAIAELWGHGSVVRSWLLDLTAMALKEDPLLSRVRPYVEDSGEGRWAVQEAIELAIPLPVIALSLQARFRSRQAKSFGAKLLATMRQAFGGHLVREAE